MQQIPLQPIPNQSFTIVLDDNSWDISLRTAKDITAVSLSLNNEVLLSNIRAVANSLIIPYRYKELKSGNFLFLTKNFELPFYTQFGLTQKLVYVSNAELEDARLPLGYPITQSVFDPNGDVPLRFKPQGYVLA